MEFELPIVEIKRKIEELSSLPLTKERHKEIEKLKEKLAKTTKEIYSNLTPYQIIQIARHPQRPYSLDYIENFIENFTELHGDRAWGDDPAIVAGFGFFEKIPVGIVAQQKGRTTQEKLKRNFGMPHPEGYRKALRIMKLAERFERPIISFVDTPGAFPGIGAEERGQAEAIATNLLEMSKLKVPIIVCIIGEGGSGGALAIALGDKVLMMEYSIYSVISAEGCSSILFKSQEPKFVEEAARNLKLTSADLKEFGIIDEIIPEPLGGAHSNPEEAIQNVKQFLFKNLKELLEIPKEELLQKRYEKFRRMGVYWEE
jgi:acetyl-CoA carboxylase carboxyl transferase subunit alpha